MERKNKGLLAAALSACLILALSSCGGDSGTTSAGTIPVYEGMTVTHSKGTASSFSRSPHHGDDEDDDENGDDVIETEIEDLVGIEVEADDEVKYYVDPNEVFTIAVHLSNPGGFEIQSFTLNGKKYANYMFEDGSDMETLYLETTAPATSGYFDYTIDAIKYIDGTEIKDVDMSGGDKSIKTGVTYDTAPSATITSREIGTTTLALGVNVSDPHNLIGSNQLSIYLTDGENVTVNKSLSVGDNELSFSGLDMSKAYEYGVVAVYDLVDGKDLHADWLLTDTFTTVGAFTFVDVNATKTSISFDTERFGDVGTIDSFSLYDAATDELIEKKDDPTAREFTGLLSDHKYDLYCDFHYESGTTTKKDWAVYEDVTTLGMTKPVITITGASSDKTSIYYEVSVEDADATLEVSQIDLLKGNEVVGSNEMTNSGTFSGLLSGVQYSIKATYQYDLNDGQGTKSDYVIKDISTLALSSPVITITDVSSDKTSVSYQVDYADSDSTIGLRKTELLNGDTVIAIGTSPESGTFTGLLSGSSYSIRVSYDYDLNDGRGTRNGYVSEDVTTVAKVAPTVSFTDSSSDKTTVYYDVTTEDADEILSITSVELLRGSDVVQSNGASLSGSFSGLLSGVSYSVRVSYTYDLNDGNGARQSSVTKEVSTVAKTKPELAIEDFLSTDKNVTGILSLTDPDGIGSIESVELYKAGELVATNASKEISFSELDAYTDYEIKTVFAYDLNDGNGMVRETFVKSFRTSPYLAFESCKVINTSAVGEGDTIYMQAILYNPSGALPSSVVVNGRSYSCSGSTSVNRIYVEIVNDGQFKGGETSLVIEKVIMSLDGNEYSLTPSSNNTGTVFINGLLSFVSAELVTEKFEQADYCFLNEKMYILIVVDNPTGYGIDSITLSNKTYTDIIKIDDSRFYIEATLTSGWNSFTVTSLSYSNEYLEREIGGLFASTESVYQLSTSEITEISTRSELMSASFSTGGYYKLTSDIDLSGLEWTNLGILEGIFDGDGHKILNMSHVTSDANPSNVGLFQYVYGIVMNLSVEDIVVMKGVGRLRFGGIMVGTENEEYPSDAGSEAVIKNCKVSGDVRGDSGIVGGIEAYQYGGFLRVISCSINMNITIDVDTSSVGRAGGIVGYFPSTPRFAASDCSITGSITAKNAAIIYYSGYEFVSGVTLSNNSCSVYINGTLVDSIDDCALPN